MSIYKNKQNLYKQQLNDLANNYRVILDGVTLTPNLLKHAAAPKIPYSRHPHEEFADCPRIKLTMLDPELQQIERKLNPNGSNPEWFNELDLTKIHCECPKKHKFEKLFDKDNSTVEAMVWTPCKHTTIAAAKRQMKAAPTPAEDVAQDFYKYACDIVDREVGTELTHFGYSVVDWYNHLCPSKQRLIQPVIQYYQGDTTHISKRDLANINNRFYTGILKEELQELDGKPRMVCSVPQVTKYIMGPVTWHLEEIFSDKFKGYCGGKNLTQMADDINNYLAQGFTKIVEGDGSSFDNTQDVSLKKIDRYIYRRVAPSIYHVPREEFLNTTQSLYKTMDIKYIKNGKAINLMRYKILGTVFSGDCDTTLMNTIRMALYNRYVNDRAGLRFGIDYVCFSKGDDFTLMYKPYVSNDLIKAAYYRYFLPPNDDPSIPHTTIYGLGQVLKFLEFGDASLLHFCSLRAWWRDPSETSIYLTRDFRKFHTLSKYSRKTKNYNYRQLLDYLATQAVALEQNYSQLKCVVKLSKFYQDKITQLHHQLCSPMTMMDIYMKSKEKYDKLLHQILHKISNQDDMKYLTYLEHQYSEFVAHRHTVYNQVTNDYWESMQLIEKQHTDTLTQEEADYISEQIEMDLFFEQLEAEYDVHPKIIA